MDSLKCDWHDSRSGCERSWAHIAPTSLSTTFFYLQNCIYSWSSSPVESTSLFKCLLHLHSLFPKWETSMANTGNSGIVHGFEHLHLGSGSKSKTFVSIHIFCFDQNSRCVCPTMLCRMIVPGKFVSPELEYPQSILHHFFELKWHVSFFIRRT